MFIQHFTGGRLQPTGILHARRAFGRPSECVNDAEVLPYETEISIELIKQNITNTSHNHPAETTCHSSYNTSPIQFREIYCNQFTNSSTKCKVQEHAVFDKYCAQSKLLKISTPSIFSVELLLVIIIFRFTKIFCKNCSHILVSFLLLFAVFIQVFQQLSIVYSSFRTFVCSLLLEASAYHLFIYVYSKELISGCVFHSAVYRSLVFIAAVTVCALYAGTLVTFRTTAPSHIFLRSSSILLAAFCLILATLTIAARCYANARHPVVQFFPYPRFLSPITFEDSISHTNTSKIVLSRLFSNFRKGVQSDTRIIVTNSKQLLYNQNFTIRTAKKLSSHYRTKREFESVQENSYNSLKNGAENLSFDTQERSSHLRTNEVYYVTSSGKIADFYNRKFDTPQKSARTNHRNLFKSSVDRSKDLLLDKERKNSLVDSASSSESTGNKSVNFSRVSNKLLAVDHQNDRSFNPTFVENPILDFGTQRPMPPAHDLYDNSLSESGVLVLVVSVVVLTVALGLVTCVLSHYRGGTAANPHDAAQTPTTAPMLSVVSAGAAAGVGGMDRLHGRGTARELAATRDRQVRVHAVHTDIAINLPPSIAMPDGEEHPFTSSRLHIRDTEQESEIYQKCIKPPPNRTVLESESPPPYRSSSAGLLGSISGSSSGSSDWSGGSAPLVVRCHSMSSTSKRPEAGSSGQKTDFIQRTVKIFTGKKSQPPSAPTLPVVIVPAKPRRTLDQQNSTGRPKPSV